LTAPAARDRTTAADPTSSRQLAAWRAREIPPVEQVRDRLWSIPVPIPQNPLRYTLCYAVEVGTGLVLIDTGWDSDAGWDALTAGLHELARRPDEVAGVLLTHIHPDHHGLTGRVVAASGAWVGMHSAELAFLQARSAAAADADRGWLRRLGVPEEHEGQLVLRAEQRARLEAMLEPDLLVVDGEVVCDGRFEVVWTPGHTPGHICLFDVEDQVLITGDHLLPRISPNVGLGPFGAVSPLASYLASLARLTGYASAEALPAHEYRFRRVAERARELMAHHESRCAELVAVLAGLERPATTWEVAARATWSRGWDGLGSFGMRAAIAETAAHLHHLAGLGALDRVTGERELWTVADGSPTAEPGG
jgi:glyoxylase-like metal-dependent hydrolase (beta-lactamase superfamily II)